MRVGFNTDLYSHYGDYQSRIKQVDVSEVKRQDEEKKASKAELTLTEQNQQYLDSKMAQEPKEQKPVALEDISTKFNRNDSYDYIGKDSSIEDLDIQKAVSDMQKDDILSQYQFFVGADLQQDAIFQNNDGTVIRK